MRSEGNAPKKWRTNGWFLFNDNAPEHRSVLLNDILAKNKVTISEYPPHSSDLATADFYRFRSMKSAMKGRGFCDAADVIKNET